LMLSRVQERLDEHEMTLEATDEAKELLARQGYDPHFGARPLRRVIQTVIEDPLSEAILAGQYNPGDTVLLEVEDDEIKLCTKELVEAAQ
jgi:ATP-dependent Clp protease ATP-binding subunit ClpC